MINKVGIGYILSYEKNMVALSVKGSQHELRMKGRLQERYIDYSLNGLEGTSLRGNYISENM